MRLREYVTWREKALIGASLTVSMPSGQYDAARLVNPGANRWGMKPEVGFSRRWGHWAADWYAGVWFLTGNRNYYPGHRVRTQEPIATVEAHVGYYLKPRLWASVDANFWTGSRSTIDGLKRQDRQRNSRIGGTVSIPVSQRHALKLGYSQGAYVTIGGAYKAFSTGWQYSWISRH